MSLNISKLQAIFDEGKFRKADVIAASGISKGTLENVLKGLDPKVSTIQAIANAVGIKVSYFFDENSSENFESHGAHGILAKNIDKIDNREMIIKSNIGKVNEEILIPADCTDEAKHIIERLQLEVNMLQQLLMRAEEQIQEKERFITHLLDKK